VSRVRFSKTAANLAVQYVENHTGGGEREELAGVVLMVTRVFSCKQASFVWQGQCCQGRRVWLVIALHRTGALHHASRTPKGRGGLSGVPYR